MLEDALRKYRISPKDTFIIGDSIVDITAGHSIGMKTIFVLSGKTSGEEACKWPVKPDYVFPNLLGAVEWILNKRKRRLDRSMKRNAPRRDKPEEGEVE